MAHRSGNTQNGVCVCGGGGGGGGYIHIFLSKMKIINDMETPKFVDTTKWLQLRPFTD